MKYLTMTVNGSHGSTFEAETDDEAVELAERAGYEVFDIQAQMDGTPILVIAE